jgi:hypothetical protein
MMTPSYSVHARRQNPLQQQRPRAPRALDFHWCQPHLRARVTVFHPSECSKQ